jgi:hypothetical protein
VNNKFRARSTFHHHTHQAEVHVQLYICIEDMCADEVDERILISGQKLLASGQEVRSTRSGCPQWEVPRVGTPAPGRCMQLGYTGEAEWRPEPRRKQLGNKQLRAEAMPSNRAAEEMRRPPSGRALEGRRWPIDEVNGLGLSSY